MFIHRQSASAIEDLRKLWVSPVANEFVCFPHDIQVTFLSHGQVLLPPVHRAIIAKLPAGVQLVYRTVGSLFNLGRLQSNANIAPTTMFEQQYAGDALLCVHTEE